MTLAQMQEIFGERAAVLEYEGGMSRADAERRARDELSERRERRYDGAIDPTAQRVARWAGERDEADDPHADIGSCVAPPRRPAPPPANVPGASSEKQAPGPSACRSCGAAIVWATTVKDGTAGKLAPWQLDDRGEWTITRAVIVGRTGAQFAAQHAGPAPMQLELGATRASGPERYTNHFATCPDASRWRAQNAKENRR